jgi:hypothetical protein
VALASGLEQGMYSLFSGYDRELFELYGLLFLDGGFGGTELQPGYLLQEAEEAAEYVICPGKGLPGQKDLLGMTLEKSELTGYTLATDNGGAAFRRQVCEAMLARLGASGLEAVTGTLKERLGIVQEQQKQAEQFDAEQIGQEYDDRKKEAAERAEEAEQRAEEAEAGQTKVSASPAAETLSLSRKQTEPLSLSRQQTEFLSLSGQQTEQPEDFENPIEVIRKLQKMGILSLAVPDASRLSDFSVEEKTLLSRREQQKGMGVLPAAENSPADKILLQEYLVEFFPCYTSEDQGEGLRYQVEYAIGKKADDMENLKSVLYRLLAVRGASNLLYLMTSPARGAEADSMALVISTVLLMPEAMPVVSLLLKVCWAFGESIVDIRELLGGGKVPLLKSDASWQLSLNQLTRVMEYAGSEKQDEGLDYQWYLRILLLMESEEQVTEALMDLTEYNLRLRRGNGNFCLDSCVEAAEIRMTASMEGHVFSAGAGYGYNME